MAHAEEQGDLEDSQVPVLGHGVGRIPLRWILETRPSCFAEALIDCEEDRTLREVLVGMLREAER